MASGVEELIGMLYDIVEDARSLPLGADKCILERDKVLDLMDEIRAQLPVELSEAKKLLASRAEYISAARRESELIKRQAEEQAKRLISQDNTMQRAREQSDEMLRAAKERTRELQRVTNEYCEDALRRTEQVIAEAYNEMREARTRFHSAASAAVGQRPDSAPPPREEKSEEWYHKTGPGDEI